MILHSASSLQEKYIIGGIFVVLCVVPIALIQLGNIFLVLTVISLITQVAIVSPQLGV